MSYPRKPVEVVERKTDDGAEADSNARPNEVPEDDLEAVTGGANKPKEIVVVGSKVK